MSEIPGGKPEHNIYTVMVLLATAIVVAATVYLGIRSQQLLGSWNPFSGG